MIRNQLAPVLIKRVAVNAHTIRKLQRRTSGEVARSLGVDHAFYSNLEAAAKPLSMRMVERLAAVLSVDPSDLMKPTVENPYERPKWIDEE